jgi:hypothetical protein
VPRRDSVNTICLRRSQFVPRVQEIFLVTVENVIRQYQLTLFRSDRKHAPCPSPKTSAMSNQLILSLDDGAVFSYAEKQFCGMRFLILARWLPRRRTGKCRTSSAVGGLQKKRETAETASMRPCVLDFMMKVLALFQWSQTSADRSTMLGNSGQGSCRTPLILH